MSAIFLALLLATQAVAQQAGGGQTRTMPLTLEELLADPDLQDAAVSPSGRYLALVLWRKDSDLVALMDLDTRATKVLTNIGHDVADKELNVHVQSVVWKSEVRIL